MLEKLKVLRTQAGISQKSLADIVGTSQQSINKYENQNVEPDISTLKRIADHFGVSVDYLIGHEPSSSNVPVLNEDELKIIAFYRALNKQQQKALINLIKEL